MLSRRWLAVTALALASSSASFLACSSSPDAPEPSDDAGTVDATVDATPRHDGSVGPSDAGLDAHVSPDTGTGVVGKCEPVQGPACDLVLQDCPPGDGGVAQECVMAAGGPPYTTACQPVSVSEHLGKGHGCCASASDKQCDPGLECVGDPTLPCDAGYTGRCTPHCCGTHIDGGDDYLCGQSDPEGFVGHCDTALVDGQNNELYNVCSYTRPCEPFGINPCPATFTCDFRDTAGSAGCDDIYSPDGGAPVEGQACFALNGCADGYACLGSGNPGTCAMMCLLPGSKPPFDAGALDGGPLGGGCPSNEACTRRVSGFPSWIAFCQ